MVPRQSLKRNYGRADSLEIWEVARAATAAPMFFKELKLDNGNTKIIFTDGGMGPTNNPTMEGIQEIKSIHGQSNSNIGIIVNIGTARGAEKPGARGIVRRFKSFANEATDPEKVVGQVQLHYSDLSYFRLNNPKPKVNIDLDEWKPHGLFTRNPGEKTLQRIEAEFIHWSGKTQNIKDIEACAKELVRRRRRRAQTSLWERYATGTYYVCPYDACTTASFHDHGSFDSHLRGTHPDSDEDVNMTIRRMKKGGSTRPGLPMANDPRQPLMSFIKY